jgi:hypothetical protein
MYGLTLENLEHRLNGGHHYSLIYIKRGKTEASLLPTRGEHSRGKTITCRSGLFF